MFGLILIVTVFVRTMLLILSDQKLRSMMFGTVVIVASGTGFYTFAEGWRVLDALYFSVVSLTTVGYGDFTPSTDLGKAFTILYLIAGVALIMGFITAAADLRFSTREERLARRTHHDNETVTDA